MVRRHLDTYLRIITAKALLEIYREKAEQRHELQRNIETGKFEPLDKILPNGESEGKAIEQFAVAVKAGEIKLKVEARLGELIQAEQGAGVGSPNKKAELIDILGVTPLSHHQL